jgi:hypothetical protein
MNNILITSGTSAFTQRVAELFPKSNIIFADSKPIPSVFLANGKYIAIPSSQKASFVHEMLAICLDLSIHKLLPLNDGELIPLAKNKILFEEYGITVLVPDLESLERLPKLINPTRADCPKIILREPMAGEQGVFGVFKVLENEELTLCCLK